MRDRWIELWGGGKRDFERPLFCLSAGQAVGRAGEGIDVGLPDEV